MNYKKTILLILIAMSAGYAPSGQAMNSTRNHTIKNDAGRKRMLQQILAKYTKQEHVHNLNYLTTIQGKTQTILHAACFEGSIELAKLLIQHGANINSPDYYKASPLDLACFKGHFEIATLMVEMGAKISHAAFEELLAYKNDLLLTLNQMINDWQKTEAELIAKGDDVALQNHSKEYTALYNEFYSLDELLIANNPVGSGDELTSKYRSTQCLPIGLARPFKLTYVEKRI